VVGRVELGKAAVILTANGCGGERCFHSGDLRWKVGIEIFDIFKAVLKSAMSQTARIMIYKARGLG
jgi:hypothetical protein